MSASDSTGPALDSEGLDRMARFLGERLAARVTPKKPRIAVVLGSGLGGLADLVNDAVVVPYEEIPGHPRSTVAGHQGAWISGMLDDVPVLLQAGRFHLYEGHEPGVTVTPIRIMARLGIDTVILTNAAGCLHAKWRPPALMLVADHIQFSFRSALRGPVVEPESRFPDLSDPYDESLRKVARRIALTAGIRLHEGVYASMLGPSYETPAEVSMLGRLGADAVGMSTVPETIAAKARGMRVLAISSLTNLAAGLSAEPLDHDDVLDAGRYLERSMQTLVRGILVELSKS